MWIQYYILQLRCRLINACSATCKKDQTLHLKNRQLLTTQACCRWRQLLTKSCTQLLTNRRCPSPNPYQQPVINFCLMQLCSVFVLIGSLALFWFSLLALRLSDCSTGTARTRLELLSVVVVDRVYTEYFARGVRIIQVCTYMYMYVRIDGSRYQPRA
jgi:hypothetical protein